MPMSHWPPLSPLPVLPCQKVAALCEIEWAWGQGVSFAISQQAHYPGQKAFDLGKGNKWIVPLLGCPSVSFSWCKPRGLTQDFSWLVPCCRVCPVPWKMFNSISGKQQCLQILWSILWRQNCPREVNHAGLQATFWDNLWTIWDNLWTIWDNKSHLSIASVSWRRACVSTPLCIWSTNILWTLILC